MMPTVVPTAIPTAAPTVVPTVSMMPTVVPTANPTAAPTVVPTVSMMPTFVPKAPAVITTLGGNGTAGFSGDNGPASIAQMNYPTGICADASGNVFIADYSNHRIRKIVLDTGVISTVAGTGIPGYSVSEDNGLAINAKLFYPNGVSADASGNLFIADKGNNLIRKVNLSSGVISTIAGNGSAGFSGDGGQATSSMLNSPYSVSVDTILGNLYIADQGNNIIRQVVLSSGVITTIAGVGSAGFSGDGAAATNAELNSPYSVSVDTLGNLYIADEGNNRVRKVVLSTGVITTIAGTGSAGFSGDGAAATNAELNSPYSVTADSSGNLYIVDNGNNRVRQVVLASGVIKTLAGTGTAGFNGDNADAASTHLNSPYGVFADSSGNVYISDSLNNRLRLVVISAAPLQRSPSSSPTAASENPTTIALLIVFVGVLPFTVLLFYLLNYFYGWSLSTALLKVCGIQRDDSDASESSMSGRICDWQSCACCLTIFGYRNNCDRSASDSAAAASSKDKEEKEKEKGYRSIDESIDTTNVNIEDGTIDSI
jgi:DNA-binding beta-propeller fold protein YncE